MKIKIKVNTANLLQVLAQTGNPEIASDILFGKYQMPKISQTAEIEDKAYQFVSYNPWDNKVQICTPRYKYVNEDKTKTEYGKPTEECTIPIFRELEVTSMDLGKWEYYANLTAEKEISSE